MSHRAILLCPCVPFSVFFESPLERGLAETAFMEIVTSRSERESSDSSSLSAMLYRQGAWGFPYFCPGITVRGSMGKLPKPSSLAILDRFFFIPLTVSSIGCMATDKMNSNSIRITIKG